MTIAASTTVGRLKLIRQELGMTQREFADRSGVNHGLILKIERGAQNITDRTIRLICENCGVNETWLRSGEGHMFVDARRDAFEQFVTVFNLTPLDREKLAKFVSYRIDDAPETKRGVERLLKAIDRGSVGRSGARIESAGI